MKAWCIVLLTVGSCSQQLGLWVGGTEAKLCREEIHTTHQDLVLPTSLISLPRAGTRFSSTSTFYLCGFFCRQCPLNSAWLSLTFFKPLMSPLPKCFLQPSGGRHLSSAPSATVMYFSSLMLCIQFGQEMQFNQFYF